LTSLLRWEFDPQLAKALVLGSTITILSAAWSPLVAQRTLQDSGVVFKKGGHSRSIPPYAAVDRRRNQIEPLNFIVPAAPLKKGFTPASIQLAASANGVVPLSTVAMTFV
jgi:hypothetical protein